MASNHFEIDQINDILKYELKPKVIGTQIKLNV